MQKRALAIDLDGTLLIGEDLPAENLAAVRRAVDAGYVVFVATARWRHMALDVAAHCGSPDPVIACSGAEVFDPNRAEDLFDERLPESFARALLEVCDENRCVATVTFSDRVLLKLDGEPDMSRVAKPIEWVTALTGADSSLPRIAAIQGSKVNEIIRNEVVPSFGDAVQVADSIGPNGKTIVTYTGRRADKGRALEVACEATGVAPADVVAFGDAENDVSMFKVAGAAVAMGQADDETKAHATFVSRPNTEFGVAYAIDRLLTTGL